MTPAPAAPPLSPAERLETLRRSRLELEPARLQARERVDRLQQHAAGMGLDELFQTLAAEQKKREEEAAAPAKVPWWKRAWQAIKSRLPSLRPRNAGEPSVSSAPSRSVEPAAQPEPQAEAPRAPSREEVQALRAEIGQALKELAAIEARIQSLDEEIAALEAQLAPTVAPGVSRAATAGAAAPTAVPAAPAMSKADEALARVQQSADASRLVGGAALGAAGKGEDELRSALEKCGPVREAFYDASLPATPKMTDWQFAALASPEFKNPRKVFLVSAAGSDFLVPAKLAETGFLRGDLLTGNEGRPRTKAAQALTPGDVVNFRPAMVALDGSGDRWRISVPGGVVVSPDLAAKVAAHPAPAPVAVPAAAALRDVREAAPAAPPLLESGREEAARMRDYLDLKNGKPVRFDNPVAAERVAALGTYRLDEENNAVAVQNPDHPHDWAELQPEQDLPSYLQPKTQAEEPEEAAVMSH